jgi:uncharacterized protein (DUF2141 family)
MVVKKLAFALGGLALLVLVALDTQAQTAVSAPAATPSLETPCPTLAVTGLKPGDGVLMIAVYASADTFFKKPAWTTAQKVSGATMQIPVCNLNEDEIAVTAFQDMNGNQKLDSNPIGIPTEPYAASGKPPMFSAPTWNDAKVPFKGATAPIPVKF